MFLTAVGLSIFGTRIILLGILFTYSVRSLGDSTFDIARYLICWWDDIMGIKSSKAYRLFGAFILLIGRSRKILLSLCF